MKSSSFEHLKTLSGTDTLIQAYRRHIDDHSLHGYVVGVSDKLLLLHIVNGDTLLLNGYSAVRIKDITSWRIDEGFVPKALKRHRRPPIVPTQFVLDSWTELLTSAQKVCTFVAIETERNEPGCCFIGRITEFKSLSITLQHATTNATWGAAQAFRLKNVSKVDLHNGYVESLADA